MILRRAGSADRLARKIPATARLSDSVPPEVNNTSLGLALGRGLSLAEALAGREGVTEGVTTAPALLSRAAAAGVELPICLIVAALLDGHLDAAGALRALLDRPPREE